MHFHAHTPVHIGPHQKTGGILALFKLESRCKPGPEAIGNLFTLKGKMQPQTQGNKKISLDLTLIIFFGVDTEIRPYNHTHTCLYRPLVHSSSSEIRSIICE